MSKKNVILGGSWRWGNEKAKINSNFDELFNERGATFPLNIPTYDDNLSITHPDVVYIPGGFAGYKYWMSFTPYPGASRENPSIVASNDKVNWEVPSGLTNPVIANAEAVADGYSYWSDASLCYHDGTIYMYFRAVGSGTEAIYVTKTTDGVTWSTRELVFASATSTSCLSPSVLHDGTQFVMHCVNYTDSAIDVRYSATYNGFLQDGATASTMPSGDYVPWHIDVAQAGGKWHSLIATHYDGTQDTARLLYFVSDDGEEWAGNLKQAIPITGYAFDTRGHYRSSIVPVVGQPLKFDVYVASYKTDATEWRVGLFEGVDLFKGGGRALEYTRSIERMARNIFIPAIRFRPYTGAVLKDNTGTWFNYYGFEMEDSAVNTIITTLDPMPVEWQGADFYIVGYWLTAPVEGNVFNFNVIFLSQEDGDAKNNNGLTVASGMPHTVAADEAVNNIQEFYVGRKLGPFGVDALFTTLQVNRITTSNTEPAHFVFLGLKIVSYEADYVSQGVLR